ncbi:MAG TPA: DUF1015 domain-containing protein [Gaiellaceae bacterium]|nr:DUF1015 domain-containing protein [Gaiellaceae bacterium]
MADVRPFRAVRYDEERAGPLRDLIAPPYDVLDDAERRAYLDRSPYNVVHLTLPDSEDEAARTWREWRETGVLVEDEQPAAWSLEQDYVGPDDVARTRRGLVASLRVEPYERRVVLPHERTHRGPKEGRLRLLRAVGAQLEPIFLLYEGQPPLSVGEEPPDVDLGDTRLWRVPAVDVGTQFADVQLLIADGHHRYETALAYHAEVGTPESAWMLVVLVSTSDPGLTIFATHRVFERLPRHAWTAGREVAPADALAELERIPYDRGAAVQVTRSGALVVEEPGLLDVELVDRLGHEGISYTPDAQEALRRVESGEAEAAYLLRATRIEDVFAVAQRGGVMPQKSTYFFPKLVSGLLFHPL